MPCRFASSGTVATSRSASRAILALNAASNFLRDLVISVLHRLRQSRTLHTLTFGPISGVHFSFCHAQPFEITRAEKIKSTLLQHSRQNAKVVEAFCHAACRLSNQCRPSIHQPPVDEFRMPAEMSIALSRAHVHARMHVASCWRRVHHRDRHQHTIPIALAALPGAILPATSCLGAFRTPAAAARG